MSLFLRSPHAKPVDTLCRWAIAISLALTSCVVSPQPSPPDPEPDLDGGGIGVLDPGTEDIGYLLTFEAAPGTVDPARGTVIVTNLDLDDAPSRVAVRSDGSFTIALAGLPGDTVRFQVDQDGNRSEPADVEVDATGQVGTLVEDAPACLTFAPARYLPLAASAAHSIVIRNDCSETVSLGAPRLRRGLGPFTFSPTAPIQIAAGDVAFITVRSSGEADEHEDVLLVDVLAPVIARRAVTLTVPD